MQTNTSRVKEEHFSWMKARAKPSHPNPLCSQVMSGGSGNLSAVLCKFQKASLSWRHCSLTSILEGQESTPWNPSSNWKCALVAHLFNPSDIRWECVWTFQCWRWATAARERDLQVHTQLLLGWQCEVHYWKRLAAPSIVWLSTLAAASSKP